MYPLEIIARYYAPGSEGWTILTEHSMAVRDMALEIASRHPELKADAEFISEAAMLHDIGIYLTDAPGIQCFGNKPYICHGYLGRELLEKEGYPLHALVCERHTGTGLSVTSIKAQKLPIPVRDMLPVSIEEQIICFADKFFSKSKELRIAKPIDRIISTLKKHGTEQVNRFTYWCDIFL